MRVVILGLLGLLLFFLIWPFVQLALLGPELASYTPPLGYRLSTYGGSSHYSSRL
jgi:hypothetical protein